MASSPLLSLPRELRDMITDNVITSDQPFRINGRPQPHLVTRTQSGLDTSCKQIQSEYASLLRRAAFTPGKRTIAPVYNFDFRELTAFVKELNSREVAAANRNGNLVVNLSILDMHQLDFESLQRWVKVCEATGCEVSYVVQWTAFDVGRMKGLQSAVGSYREGRKILKVLGSRSVKCWSWEGYQDSLKSCR